MKKSLLTAFLLFILFSTGNIFAQIQGNSFFIDSSTKNYTLKDNEGKREVFVEINFAKPFSNKPTVLASISLLDITGEKYDIQPDINTTIENKLLLKQPEFRGMDLF